MRTKQLRFVVVVILGLAILTSLSLGVAAESIFDSVTQLIGGDSVSSIGEAYANANTSLWIDLIFYIVLFIAVGKYAFRQQQGLMSLGTIVGVGLAIGATAFEYQSTFRIGDLGGLAIAVVLLVIAWVLYKLLHGMGFGSYHSAAVAYVVIYGFYLSIAKEVLVYLNKSGWGAVVVTVLNVGFFAAIIGVIFWAISWWRGSSSSSSSTPSGGATSPAATAAAATTATQNVRQDQVLKKQGAMESKLIRAVEDLDRQVEESAGQQNQLAQQLGGAVTNLQNIDNEIIRDIQNAQAQGVDAQDDSWKPLFEQRVKLIESMIKGAERGHQAAEKVTKLTEEQGELAQREAADSVRERVLANKQYFGELAERKHLQRYGRMQDVGWENPAFKKTNKQAATAAMGQDRRLQQLIHEKNEEIKKVKTAIDGAHQTAAELKGEWKKAVELLKQLPVDPNDSQFLIEDRNEFGGLVAIFQRIPTSLRRLEGLENTTQHLEDLAEQVNHQIKQVLNTLKRVDSRQLRNLRLQQVRQKRASRSGDNTPAT